MNSVMPNVHIPDSLYEKLGDNVCAEDLISRYVKG